jgi:hypothetical protein
MKKVCLIIAGVALLYILGVAGSSDAGTLTFGRIVLHGAIGGGVFAGSIYLAQWKEKKDSESRH